MESGGGELVAGGGFEGFLADGAGFEQPLMAGELTGGVGLFGFGVSC